MYLLQCIYKNILVHIFFFFDFIYLSNPFKKVGLYVLGTSKINEFIDFIWKFGSVSILPRPTWQIQWPWADIAGYWEIT